ncbi:hypothetical protein FRUB_06334 [Fimbriiglobus ruber]|uniref:Uncharacterized protein n=1 Tax=Fimbriiglobus ruber TaxID=1908690 RepID=A0A225DK36_9BACT|nr:hypothetical protein FRUB_06334 [Fimbriiglobus ruber]
MFNLSLFMVTISGLIVSDVTASASPIVAEQAIGSIIQIAGNIDKIIIASVVIPNESIPTPTTC